MSFEEIYKKLLKKPEKKPEVTKRIERIRHNVTAFIGFCSHCNDVRGKGDLVEIVKRGKGVREILVKSIGAKYVCDTCGWPYDAKTKEELERIPECYFCGSKKAVPLE